VRDKFVEGSSGAGARRPVVFKVPAETATAKCNDGVGAAYGPEHARLLETAANDRLTACLDDAGADEELLRAELRIAHWRGVAFEVVSLCVTLVGQLRIGSFQAAQIARKLLLPVRGGGTGGDRTAMG